MTIDNSKSFSKIEEEKKDYMKKDKFITQTISQNINDLATKNKIDHMQSIDKQRKHINSILIEKFSSRNY